MIVSTTLVSNMLDVALAGGGGGGGGRASPVGMLPPPASVLTETSPVSTTANRKRFIVEFLLKDF